MSAASVAVVVTSGEATKERQAWCCLQVKLCDPCLSALCVPSCKKALYKYSSFPFLLRCPDPEAVSDRYDTPLKYASEWELGSVPHVGPLD